MAMQTFYTVTATFEIGVDPAKPDTLAKAAKWIESLQGGTVVTKPDGLDFAVSTTAAKIKNRR